MLILPHPAHVYKYIKIAWRQSDWCAAVEDVAQATAEQKVTIARDDGPMNY